MTETNFRALCAELTTTLENTWEIRPKVIQELLDRARAALAQPEPEGPRPLKERPDFIAGYREGLADRKRITEHEEAEQPPTALAQPEPVAPTIQPVPVSERLPGPEDCDSEGRCWMFDPCDRGWWAYRSALPSDDELGRPPWTHWLPYWALPVPADTINQEANDNESSSK
jgi:hypothetical protein